MAHAKNGKGCGPEKKSGREVSPRNDQLGENAGEGRLMKEAGPGREPKPGGKK